MEEHLKICELCLQIVKSLSKVKHSLTCQTLHVGAGEGLVTMQDSFGHTSSKFFLKLLESSGHQTLMEGVAMHVSDIHCSYDNVQKLKEKIKQEEIKLDVVLISGDVANVPLDQYHTASKELLQEHHDILLRIVTEFVPVAEKVYFIPGNHDTLSHYDKSPLSPESSTTFPVNIHSHKLKIAPELYLLGLGGSVPGFREGKEHWEGFPYSTDAKFGEDLSALLDPVMEGEEETPGTSYILMTHDGPNSSTTTLVQAPPEPDIIGGSDVLYEYLCKKKMQERTVLNVHGHVHPAIGMATIGSISVINPGALVEGNYGIYDLKRSSSGQQCAWKLSRASLCRL